MDITSKRNVQGTDTQNLFRGQTLQVKGMCKCTQNWFTVQVFIEPVYSTVQGWNLFNNKSMEKLTFKR